MLGSRLAGAPVVVACVAACAACGDDAARDASITIDIDNGSCGDQINFTGELVDWDNDTTFCGVFDALFEVQGGGAMDRTAPNGRFEGICVPNAAVTLLDVTPSTGNSQCTSPPSPYPMAGIAVANKSVILAGGFFSIRTFTTARRTTFFQAAGLTFDPAKAQVFVHVDGTPRAVSIAAAHDAPQAVSGTTWGPGDTGHDVFFPNVDPGGGTAMLAVAGGAIGTGSIPLAAGKFTYLTVLVR